MITASDSEGVIVFVNFLPHKAVDLDVKEAAVPNQSMFV